MKSNGQKLHFCLKTLALTSHVCQLLKQGKRWSICKNFTLMNKAFFYCIIAIQHDSRNTTQIKAENLWRKKKKIINAITSKP